MDLWRRLFGRSRDHVDGEMLMRCSARKCATVVVMFPGTGKLLPSCPRCGMSLKVDRHLHKQLRNPGQRAFSLDGAEMAYVPEGRFLMGSTLAQAEAALNGHNEIHGFMAVV